MNSFIDKYSEVWGSNPKQLMEEYNYNLDLTNKLDNLNVDDFSRESFYEIILWKLNRFPIIEDTLLDELKTLSSLKNEEHEISKEILKKLLSCSGIRLPMASTILRFINPNVFQIIDDRVFRILFAESKMPTKPAKVTEKYLNNSCDIYFKYIDKLVEICDDDLPFFDADRIIYFLDKKLGNKIED
ncbi:MAG: hypothetical protein COA39_000290 [Sulfurimonas sp.]|nr:hypothetical protein [Sulfurimonas sp.]